MEQFGKGLFIRNDKNGEPCCIGDYVRIKFEGGYYSELTNTESYSNDNYISGYIVEGKLCLGKTNGCYIYVKKYLVKGENDDNFNEPTYKINAFNGLKMTDNTVIKQEWEKLKSN